MPIVAAIVGLAALVWGAICARRGSLVLGCGLFVVVGYILGHEFWSAKLGPLPITLDRLVLLGILAAVAIQWRIGRLTLRKLTTSDCVLAALLCLLIASAATSGAAEFLEGATSKWGRLAASFVLPAVLYFVARFAPVSSKEWSRLLMGLVLLGTYLAVTAVLEVTGHWSLVFPRYIANPELGIHFGRARGPGLNAASLGIYLTACLWCAWILLGQATQRWQQLALVIVLPLMAGGIFFTYTRSTWLGLAASGVVVAAMQIPRRWRLPAFSAATLGGLLVIAASWSQVVGLQREGSAAESEHSVDQRTSFAYVSWQMFCDNPLFGVGFGRFYDRKLPYLSDRSQPFELESIRPLHHHNTLLSMLTETGLVGMMAFTTLVMVWCWQAWLLSRNRVQPNWVRGQGVLMLAITTNYLCSAVFHDLTLVPSQHWLLFLFAGITVNLQQIASVRAAAKSSDAFELGQKLRRIEKSLLGEPKIVSVGSNCGPIVSDCGHSTPYSQSPNRNPRLPQSTSHIRLFGMQISRVTMPEAIDRLLDWCCEPRGEACRYVVTPNVDHAVLFQDYAALREAYADASLVLADGAPIVLASRLLGQELPERVAGSDLVPRLFDAADQPLRVFLLGAAPGIAEIAAEKIQLRWNHVRIVGTYSPPPGFEQDATENSRILSLVAAAQPDVLIIGLGAPKQELWMHRHRYQLQAKVALCAGATIDFLAEHRPRSPVWMRRAGLEWVHRVWCEPRRLAARYARDAWIFPRLLWREWRQTVR